MSLPVSSKGDDPNAQPAAAPVNPPRVLQPAGWAPPRGYANGVAVTGGTQVFVAGQIGWNAQCQFESSDLVDRCARRCTTCAPCSPKPAPRRRTSCA